MNCVISEASVEVGREQFSVVTCVDSDDLLQHGFSRQPRPSCSLWGRHLQSRSFEDYWRGSSSCSGWPPSLPEEQSKALAELWLVAQAREPGVLMGAWHGEPTDAYDFNNGQDRVEVKSTGLRTKRHTFSHRQLQPPASARVVIASVFVESVRRRADHIHSGLRESDAG